MHPRYTNSVVPGFHNNSCIPWDAAWSKYTASILGRVWCISGWSSCENFSKSWKARTSLVQGAKRQIYFQGRGDYDEAEFDQDADDFDDGNLSLKLLDTISIYHNTADHPNMPVLTHGEPLTDRRSTFQAHLAPVVKTEQVQQVVARLKETRKIATATHNIMAYRIWSEERKVFLQDCDDDGEAAAGGRLLHLLQVLDARDVVVVVSRWFGGILLGPDRFKHINNCARNLLLVQGYLSSSTKVVKDSTKARKAKGKKTKH